MNAYQQIDISRALAKMPTGIEGMDEITLGGLPRSRTTLLLGSAGTGKTVFALQTLVNGARLYGEPGIFVAIEENSRQLLQNAATFGWDLPELIERDLFFLDARLSPELVQAGQFDLVGLLASLKAKADQMGAKRIVFDSLDVLLTMMDNPGAGREEVYRLHDWLGGSGLTGIITAGTQGPDSEMSSYYDFMQFMADCVVFLRHAMVERVSLREVRVIKYRGSKFLENEYPMVIGKSGIEIATLGAPGAGQTVSAGRVSTGVERLDNMLEGGYFRGSSTLITGSPGTAKSTLSAAFVRAACERGERALYVSFDEGAGEIVRNMESVDIRLRPHVESGLLRIFSSRSEARSAEEHLIELKQLMREFNPTCVAVDPISAMLKAGGHLSAIAVAQRLLFLTKAAGITLLATSLVVNSDPRDELTEMHISTVADTWIHLTYVAHGGERNRALTIVKARGTNHSNQVRELVLSDQGITLADVYAAGGEILMGTLRWEREQALLAAKRSEQTVRERRRRELESTQAELLDQMRTLRAQLEAGEAEIRSLAEEGIEQAGLTASEQMELLRLRRSDDGSPRAAGRERSHHPPASSPDPEADLEGQGEQ